MSKQDEARRRRLRHQVKQADGPVPIAADDVRWLLDEVGRLQQGNDRLRRQNRRLRLRAQGAGDPDGESEDVERPEGDVGDPGDADPEADLS